MLAHLSKCSTTELHFQPCTKFLKLSGFPLHYLYNGVINCFTGLKEVPCCMLSLCLPEEVPGTWE